MSNLSDAPCSQGQTERTREYEPDSRSACSVIVELVHEAALGLNFGESFETMLNSGVPG